MSAMEKMRALKAQQRAGTAQPQQQQPRGPDAKVIGAGVPTKDELMEKHGGYTPELN